MNACHVRSPGRRGFTLIELLVVVAIVAVLSSLLLPGLARAREAARSAECRTNLKQLVTALYMHGDDHDGRLPAGYVDYGNASVLAAYLSRNECTNNWTRTLNVYLGANVADCRGTVFQCPSPSKVYPNAPSGSLYDNPPSYIYNGFVLIRPGVTSWYNPYGVNADRDVFKLGEHTAPERWDVFTDCYTAIPNSIFNLYLQGSAAHLAARANGNAHQFGLNIAYLDGHVLYQRLNGVPFFTKAPPL